MDMAILLVLYRRSTGSVDYWKRGETVKPAGSILAGRGPILTVPIGATELGPVINTLVYRTDMRTYCTLHCCKKMCPALFRFPLEACGPTASPLAASCRLKLM